MTETSDPAPESKFSLLRWMRNRFFTGVVIALPVVITIAGISWFVQIIDENVLRFLPDQWNPKTYIGFDIPGLGLIIAVILLFVLGIIASNFIGNYLIRAGERVLARVPVVSSVYAAIKQIITTVADQKDRAFRDVCLIEYPRKGLWAVGFVTSDLKGAPTAHLKKDYVCVFVPTTPNPTSGFLLFAKKEDIKILDMTPEAGAKMIVSGGMVASGESDIARLEAMMENSDLVEP